EFPVVLLADLAHGVRGDFGDLAYGRELGVALKPRWRGAPVKSERWRAIGERKRADADAELTRLLYVAVTRAQEEVVLFGPTSKTRGNSFAKLLEPWRDAAARDGVLAVQRAPETRERLSSPLAPARPTRDDVAWAESVVAAAQPVAPAGATRLALPV